MKKLLILTLALVLALSLAACGGNTDNSGNPSGTNGNSSTPDTSQGGNVSGNNNGGNETETLTTIEGWLTAFGLTESDLKCAHYNRLDITSYVTSSGKITSVGAFVSEVLTDEEARAWIEQIITKLNSLSGSGQIDRLQGDGEALTADYIMEQQMYIGSGSYNYNGKAVNVVITVMPNSLDNDDPDVAMAACTLKLEWK